MLRSLSVVWAPIMASAGVAGQPGHGSWHCLSKAEPLRES